MLALLFSSIPKGINKKNFGRTGKMLDSYFYHTKIERAQRGLLIKLNPYVDNR
jgi:hypothetical protein